MEHRQGGNVMTIRKSIKVERPPQIAFRIFCEAIGQWWPKGPSFKGNLGDTILEGRIGGRFFQRYTDGTEYEIGRVTAYEPPSIVAFTWHAPSWDTTTQVEIRFSPEAGGTRVELEHSGWELSAKTRDARNNYDSGWGAILGHYQAASADPADRRGES
jgi:uncharacterized protein YndB with AHSA1/START domain